MTVAEKKLGIIEKVRSLSDAALLDSIEKLIKEHDELEDWLATYPEEIRASIKRGIEQADMGQTEPHEDMVKKIEAWREQYAGQRKQK